MGQSVTDNYDALLSTTMRNARGVVEDLASTSNIFWYNAKKNDNYKVVDNLGYQIQQPLMTDLGTPTVYSNYDVINTTPRDGTNTAFFDWRQFGDSVTISGTEEAKNRGENAIANLLAVKAKQTSLGMIELWNRAFLQGNGINVATQVATAYTDASTSALFVDPIAKLISKSGTGTVGGIDAAVQTKWKNQYTGTLGSSYESHLNDLRNVFNSCGKGPGGTPDTLLFDQLAFELTERALAKYHHNLSYTKADVPFDNFTWKGATCLWDQYVIDADNTTAASVPVSSSATCYFLNSKYITIYVDKQANFDSQGFQRPYNQDAKTSLILWRGAVTVSNRRKLGALGSIDTAATS